MARAPAGSVIKALGGNVDEIVPSTHEQEYKQLLRRIPAEHHDLVIEGARHGASFYEKIFAAAAASILVREEMQPNSAVTLWPIVPTTGVPLAGGASATNNTVVYPLQPVINGATSGPFQFVRGMRFFGLMTGAVDSSAGWCVSAGTMKLSTDAISGIQYSDTSFGLWEPDVVLGRQVLGEYVRHAFIEQVTFYASAILRANAGAAMLQGLTLQYWDFRCREDTSTWKIWNHEGGNNFHGLVRDLIEEADSTGNVTRLFSRRMARAGGMLGRG